MKRHLFYKIFATYLVIIALTFFVLNLFVRDEIKKWLMEYFGDNHE